MKRVGEILLVLLVVLGFSMALASRSPMVAEYFAGGVDHARSWVGLQPQERPPGHMGTRYEMRDGQVVALVRVSVPPGQRIHCGEGIEIEPHDNRRRNEIVECEIPLVPPSGEPHGTLNHDIRTIVDAEDDDPTVFVVSQLSVEYVERRLESLTAASRLSNYRSPGQYGDTNRDSLDRTRISALDSISLCESVSKVCQGIKTCTRSYERGYNDPFRLYYYDNAQGLSPLCVSIDQCFDEHYVPAMRDEIFECPIGQNVYVTDQHFIVTPDGTSGGYNHPLPLSRHFFASGNLNEDVLEPVPITTPVPQYTFSDEELEDPHGLFSEDSSRMLILPHVRLRVPQDFDIESVELTIGDSEWYVLRELCPEGGWKYQDRYNRGERIYVNSVGDGCEEDWAVNPISGLTPGEYETSIRITYSGETVEYHGETLEVVSGGPSEPVFEEIAFELQDGGMVANVRVTVSPGHSLKCGGHEYEASESRESHVCVVPLDTGFTPLDIIASYSGSDDLYRLVYEEGYTFERTNDPSVLSDYTALARGVISERSSELFDDNFRNAVAAGRSIHGGGSETEKDRIRAYSGDVQVPPQLNEPFFEGYTERFRTFCSVLDSMCPGVESEYCPSEGVFWSEESDSTVLDYMVRCAGYVDVDECYAQSTDLHIEQVLDSCEDPRMVFEFVKLLFGAEFYPFDEPLELPLVWVVHSQLEGIDPDRLFGHSFRSAFDDVRSGSHDLDDPLTHWPVVQPILEQEVITSGDLWGLNFNEQYFDRYTDEFRSFCEFSHKTCSNVDTSICPTVGGVRRHDAAVFDYIVSCAESYDSVVECFEQDTLPHLRDAFSNCVVGGSVELVGDYYVIASEGGYPVPTFLNREVMHKKVSGNFIPAGQVAQTEDEITPFVYVGLPRRISPSDLRVELLLVHADSQIGITGLQYDSEYEGDDQVFRYSLREGGVPQDVSSRIGTAGEYDIQVYLVYDEDGDRKTIMEPGKGINIQGD